MSHSSRAANAVVLAVVVYLVADVHRCTLLFRSSSTVEYLSMLSTSQLSIVQECLSVWLQRDNFSISTIRHAIESLTEPHMNRKNQINQYPLMTSPLPFEHRCRMQKQSVAVSILFWSKRKRWKSMYGCIRDFSRSCKSRSSLSTVHFLNTVPEVEKAICLPSLVETLNQNGQPSLMNYSTSVGQKRNDEGNTTVNDSFARTILCAGSRALRWHRTPTVTPTPSESVSVSETVKMKYSESESESIEKKFSESKSESACEWTRKISDFSSMNHISFYIKECQKESSSAVEHPWSSVMREAIQQ